MPTSNFQLSSYFVLLVFVVFFFVIQICRLDDDKQDLSLLSLCRRRISSEAILSMLLLSTCVARWKPIVEIFSNESDYLWNMPTWWSETFIILSYFFLLCDSHLGGSNFWVRCVDKYEKDHRKSVALLCAAYILKHVMEPIHPERSLFSADNFFFHSVSVQRKYFYCFPLLHATTDVMIASQHYYKFNALEAFKDFPLQSNVF